MALGRRAPHGWQFNQIEEEVRLGERDHRSLVLWAAGCAERVRPYFEEKYPEDSRPRDALEAGRGWVRGEVSMSRVRAAALAAHVAGHAPHAANYTLSATTEALSTGSTAADEERDWQDRLPERLRPVAFPARGGD